MMNLVSRRNGCSSANRNSDVVGTNGLTGAGAISGAAFTFGRAFGACVVVRVVVCIDAFGSELEAPLPSPALPPPRASCAASLVYGAVRMRDAIVLRVGMI